MKLNELALIGVATATVVSCAPAKNEYASYELYPVRSKVRIRAVMILTLHVPLIR